MIGLSSRGRASRAGALVVALMTVLGVGSATLASFPGQNGLFLTMGQGMVRTVDPTTGASVDVYPGLDAAWSPDGAHMAVSVVEGMGLDVVVGVDGADPVNLTADEDGLALEPSWSPDGQRLVYASHAEPGVLTTMARDGTEKQRIVLSGSFDAALSPRWSPDGKASRPSCASRATRTSPGAHTSSRWRAGSSRVPCRWPHPPISDPQSEGPLAVRAWTSATTEGVTRPRDRPYLTPSSRIRVVPKGPSRKGRACVQGRVRHVRRVPRRVSRTHTMARS